MPASFHRSYILRLWVEGADSDHPILRWSIEDPTTGQRRGFISLEELMAYLRDEVTPLMDISS